MIENLQCQLLAKMNTQENTIKAIQIQLQQLKHNPLQRLSTIRIVILHLYENNL